MEALKTNCQSCGPAGEGKMRKVTGGPKKSDNILHVTEESDSNSDGDEEV